MAREKEEIKIINEEITPKANTLSSDQIIYEGSRGDRKTVYKKGTALSDIKPEHKKYFGLK